MPTFALLQCTVPSSLEWVEAVSLDVSVVVVAVAGTSFALATNLQQQNRLLPLPQSAPCSMFVRAQCQWHSLMMILLLLRVVGGGVGVGVVVVIVQRTCVNEASTSAWAVVMMASCIVRACVRSCHMCVWLVAINRKTKTTTKIPGVPAGAVVVFVRHVDQPQPPPSRAKPNGATD